MNNLSSLDLEYSVFVWLQCHPREVNVDVAYKHSLENVKSQTPKLKLYILECELSFRDQYQVDYLGMNITFEKTFSTKLQAREICYIYIMF